MMKVKSTVLIAIVLLSAVCSVAQQKATIREYKKTFRTYPFSDPDPVPEISKIYPYYRFDGYTNVPVNKDWNVVELENDYIKVMVLPEIGGKVWAAIDKSTNKSFIYFNQVVKFRDVAMRGPWTSGGLEPNYGIVGHTPNCATPVDYTIIRRDDGSVSCVVGVLDLLTRSTWRVDVNLQKDKAYFTTSSTWYNASPFEQPYYHWMNGAMRAADDLQFVFPGTKYIGHGGEYANWPIDEKGRDLSFYRNNDFGSYKSYHVFGKHSNFWGGYYHDEDFGMARYSGYDDKAGKKIWIWGLSREGMIWDKLLTDDDGQYVEVQSGRLFNQPAEGSSLTPFKNRGFAPHMTDKWTEYWMPVKGTSGLVAASDIGSLNLENRNGKLLIYFNAAQPFGDSLVITDNNKVVYAKKLNVRTMEVFRDSITAASTGKLQVVLGKNRLVYDASPDAGNISRPFETPASFNWNSVQGLHIQGKEFIRQRMYPSAEEKLRAALQSDSNYLPALADFALLMYRQMNYEEALAAARRALAIDAYDPAANYYYGLINERSGRITDAKDGFDIATQSVEFRSASYTRLASIYYREGSYDRAIHHARNAIAANSAAVDAYQLLALIYRTQNDKKTAGLILDSLTAIDPLNHFANFERYLHDRSDAAAQRFKGMVRNEMPEQTFLELAAWYYNAGRNNEALAVLEFGRPNAEISYWKSFLSGKPLDTAALKPDLAFPFRHESAEVLQSLLARNDHWLLKYHLGLIRWNSNDSSSAKKLFDECGELPQYAPFYAVRAKLYMPSDKQKALSDLQKARSLEKNQWRYSEDLINYYLANNQPDQAQKLAATEFKKYPDNYVLGMLYVKASIDSKDYATANALLDRLNVLPNEGATGGRLLYRNTKLMLAAQSLRKGDNKKAQQYISQSREWPERLGSGKPYTDDLDERLEDWLSYISFSRSKNAAAAAEALNRILKYDAQRDMTGRPSINNLVYALAQKRSGNEEAGRKHLQSITEKNKDDVLAKWNLEKFSGRNVPAPDEIKKDENYRILADAGAFE